MDFQGQRRMCNLLTNLAFLAPGVRFTAAGQNAYSILTEYDLGLVLLHYQHVSHDPKRMLCKYIKTLQLRFSIFNVYQTFSGLC